MNYHEKLEEIVRQAIQDGEAPVFDDLDDEPGGRCPHCGKAYEDMSYVGCARCDARDPCFGLA